MNEPLNITLATRTECGTRVANRLWTSCLNAFLSILATLALFLTVCMKPFTSAPPGVTFLCWNPSSWACFANLDPLNGGPLSVFTSYAIPYVARTRVSWGITTFAEVLVTNSTTGYLEYWSQNTKAMSLFGNGPAKSTLIFFHGPVGKW